MSSPAEFDGLPLELIEAVFHYILYNTAVEHRLTLQQFGTGPRPVVTTVLPIPEFTYKPFVRDLQADEVRELLTQINNFEIAVQDRPRVLEAFRRYKARNSMFAVEVRRKAPKDGEWKCEMVTVDGRKDVPSDMRNHIRETKYRQSILYAPPFFPLRYSCACSLLTLSLVDIQMAFQTQMRSSET
jgi:integrase